MHMHRFITVKAVKEKTIRARDVFEGMVFLMTHASVEYRWPNTEFVAAIAAKQLLARLRVAP